MGDIVLASCLIAVVGGKGQNACGMSEVGAVVPGRTRRSPCSRLFRWQWRLQQGWQHRQSALGFKGQHKPFLELLWPDSKASVQFWHGIKIARTVVGLLPGFAF